MQQEHPVVPQDVGERGAGLRVGLGVGQFVVLAERFAVVARSDATGQVHALRHDIGPDGVERVDVGPVAGERGDVGHAAVQVARAHGVADRFALLGHGQVVLGVAEVVVVGLQVAAVGLAALVEKELREIEEATLPGRAVELHQADFDLLVAGNVAHPAGPEDAVDQFRVADRHLQQGALAGGLVVGDGGLVQVTDVVQLMADQQVRPAREPLPFGFHPGGVDGAGGVEVAVLLLGAGDLGDEVVEVGIELGVAAEAQRAGGSLDHFEHIGVVEEDALVGARHEARRLGEVVDAAGLLALAEVVGNGDLTVGREPRQPEAVVERHRRERNRRDGIVHVSMYYIVLAQLTNWRFAWRETRA